MRRSLFLVLALVCSLVTVAGAAETLTTLSDREVARALNTANSTARLYLTIDTDDGVVFAATHHCCNAHGCTGPVPSNSTCGGPSALMIKCEHTIDVNGKDVPIPPLCSPVP